MTKEQAAQASAWYWRSRNFGVDFVSPYNLRCQQYYSKLGLKQAVELFIVDEGNGVAVTINFSASLTDTGAVAGAVGAVLVLPVTVVVGAVSYIEYDNDAQRLMADYWAYMNSFLANPVPPTTPPPQPSWAQQPLQQSPQPLQETTAVPSPVARPCPSCGASLDPDSRFCKYCGARI